MSDTELPPPKVENWRRLYDPNAQARCIKDNPPMHGFGRQLKVGDVVNVKGICWRNKYELSVPEECAFYELEGYFEVLLSQPPTSDEGTPLTDAFWEVTRNKERISYRAVSPSEAIEFCFQLEERLNAAEKQLGECTGGYETLERTLHAKERELFATRRDRDDWMLKATYRDESVSAAPQDEDVFGHKEAQAQIELCVREIQTLCDAFGYDPTEWLNDETAQGEAAAPQEGKAGGAMETGLAQSICERARHLLEPEVAVGQTWKESDPLVTRTVKVVGIHGDKVALRNTQTNRLSYASKSRFHGRSGGYIFVPDATSSPPSKAEGERIPGGGNG